MSVHSELEFAGDVDLQELLLHSSTGAVISLLDYLVEMTITEDMFSNFLNGEITISDSGNIIRRMPIVGEEYLIVKIKTPSIEQSIDRIFRIYAVHNRTIIKDQNTQIYVLKFCSTEALLDSLTPLFNAFEGRIDIVVTKLYEDYLKSLKNFTVSRTDKELSVEMTGEQLNLNVLTQTENSVKFVSPGWTPFKCINWLCSKSIPKSGKACNFLFWETTHGFYYGSVETLFELDNNINIGTYSYSIPNTKDTTDTLNKMFLIENIEIPNQSDYFRNFDLGYLASNMLSLNMFNKKFEHYVYDHVEKFRDYKHSNFVNPVPLFSDYTLRNANTNIHLYPIYPNLFTNVIDNVNEKVPQIYGNRNSNIVELSNFRVNIIVPGRTDVEAGNKVSLYIPDIGPRSEEDISKNFVDTSYSGDYLITCITHKFTPLRHYMAMELVKDSNRVLL